MFNTVEDLQRFHAAAASAENALLSAFPFGPTEAEAARNIMHAFQHELVSEMGSRGLIDPAAAAAWAVVKGATERDPPPPS